jgi:hypothetical protein
MAVRLGISEIVKAYLGATEVDKIYLGITEVYSGVDPAAVIANDYEVRVLADSGTYENATCLIDFIATIL